MPVVEFHAARNGGVMTKLNGGRIAFPERRDPRPKAGETWEVEIAGTNPRGTVNFLRCVRRVEYCQFCGEWNTPQHARQHAAEEAAAERRRAEEREREAAAREARRQALWERLPATDVLVALKRGEVPVITGESGWYSAPIEVSIGGARANFASRDEMEFAGWGFLLSMPEASHLATLWLMGWDELVDDIESFRQWKKVYLDGDTGGCYTRPAARPAAETWRWEGAVLRCAGRTNGQCSTLDSAQAEGLALTIPGFDDEATLLASVNEAREREVAEAAEAARRERVEFLTKRILAFAGDWPRHEGRWATTAGETLSREAEVAGHTITLTSVRWYDTGDRWAAPSDDGYRPGGWYNTGRRGNFGRRSIAIDGEDVDPDTAEGLAAMEALVADIIAAAPAGAVNPGESLDEAITRINSAVRYGDAPDELSGFNWEFDEAGPMDPEAAAAIRYQMAVVDPDGNVVVWTDSTVNSDYSRSGNYVQLRMAGWFDIRNVDTDADPRTLRAEWRREE